MNHPLEERARELLKNHRCKNDDCWLDVTNEDCAMAFLTQVQAEARERALEEAAQVCEKVARVTVSTGATPGCTADAIREAGKWKTFEQPAPPTLSVEQAHRWRGSALDEGAPTNAAYRIWNDLTEFIAFLGPLENKYKAIAAIQGRIVEMLNERWPHENYEAFKPLTHFVGMESISYAIRDEIRALAAVQPASPETRRPGLWNCGNPKCFYSYSGFHPPVLCPNGCGYGIVCVRPAVQPAAKEGES